MFNILAEFECLDVIVHLSYDRIADCTDKKLVNKSDYLWKAQEEDYSREGIGQNQTQKGKRNILLEEL